MLISALRDRGIPTWQDINDLPTTPTENELRRVLADQTTASAILFLTPEVEHSATIREIEAPAILNRYQKGDAFFVVPVAAGGVDYSDIPRILGPNPGIAHLPAWNIHRATTDPIDSAAAAAVAEIVLDQRLAAVEKVLPPHAALPVTFSTRAPLPKTIGSALSIDLAHHFTGRFGSPRAWSDAILPGLASIARAIRVRSPNRQIEIRGFPTIPAAIALGAAFLSVAGAHVCWVQDQSSFGNPVELWGLLRVREPSHFETRIEPRCSDAADIAVLVSVAADVMADFAVTAAILPPLRALISVSLPTLTSPRGTRIVLTAGQALDVAHLTIDAVRRARALYSCRGAVHLFMGVPAGLAMMIGQLLNTLGSVQTYEHVPGRAIPYEPAALLEPSI